MPDPQGITSFKQFLDSVNNSKHADFLAKTASKLLARSVGGADSAGGPPRRSSESRYGQGNGHRRWRSSRRVACCSKSPVRSVISAVSIVWFGGSTLGSARSVSRA